jgi:hypothetical protein
VLVAPTTLLYPDAARGGTLALEPDAFGLCAITGKILRERHLDGGHEIDCLAHVFALGSTYADA